MGYGSRALELLEKYYQGKIPNLTEEEDEPKQEADVVEPEVRNRMFSIFF